MVLTPLLKGRLSVVCTFAILGLGVAACGSSSSSTSASGGSSATSAASSGGTTSSASSGSSNSTLAALQAIVQAHEKDPTQIAPTVPISKPIPTGKHIVYVNCGAPACTEMGQSLAQAAQVLGWTVSDIVATQRRLLDAFGIDNIVAMVGPSYGGYQAFQWAGD